MLRRVCLVSPRREVPLLSQRRQLTRLYTSFSKGELYPNQLVAPAQRAAQFRSKLRSQYGRAPAPDKSKAGELSREDPVKWADAAATDVLAIQNESSKDMAELRPQRPYVPLGDAAKIELQGDYLAEGGLHQESLMYYGVAAKVYSIAYPENHNQVAGIFIKLGSALRQTNRLTSSKVNLEKALAMLDANKNPSLELICECLMELGQTKARLGESDAGQVYEDIIVVLDKFYEVGESHRMLRFLPKLGRSFNLNQEEKFVYFSPFDQDRTFAIAHEALNLAEAFYEGKGDLEGVVRTLEFRKELTDSKNFNMRDYAGRVRTMRGRWTRRCRILTNAPTPDELLRFSPTVHEVYRDFKLELNAPIGQEGEVQQGTGRTVLDDGSPHRKMARNPFVEASLYDAKGNLRKSMQDFSYNSNV
jgi:tetratricopeptide (TPR) repeat protein